MEPHKRLAAIADHVVAPFRAEGLSISFHHDMPSPPGQTEVKVEVFEGRDDDEAVLARNAHVFEEGMRLQRVVMMKDVSDACLADIVRTWLQPAVEVLREDMETRAMGYDPLDPPETILRCGEVLRSILLSTGLGRTGISTKREADGTVLRPRGGISMGRVSMSAVRGRGYEFEMELRRRTLYARRIVTDQRLAPQVVDMRVYDAEDGTRITTCTPPLPETILGMMPGRRIGDMLDHPSLDLCRDVEIVACSQDRQSDGSSLLHLDVRWNPVMLHEAE